MALRLAAHSFIVLFGKDQLALGWYTQSRVMVLTPGAKCLRPERMVHSIEYGSPTKIARSYESLPSIPFQAGSVSRLAMSTAGRMAAGYFPALEPVCRSYPLAAGRFRRGRGRFPGRISLHRAGISADDSVHSQNHRTPERCLWISYTVQWDVYCTHYRSGGNGTCRRSQSETAGMAKPQRGCHAPGDGRTVRRVGPAARCYGNSTLFLMYYIDMIMRPHPFLTPDADYLPV